MNTCQCPDIADHHLPGECDGTPRWVVLRDGQRFEVCYDCWLGRDETIVEIVR